MKKSCIRCFDSPLHHGPCLMLNRKDYNRCKHDEDFFYKLDAELTKKG